jgi:small GTP-binding protein
MTAPILNLAVLEGEIATLRLEEIELINQIANALTGEETDIVADRQKLRELAQDLSEMFFMVVVIGEFNSGKSSFINALLGYNLLDVGIIPTTQYIELIRYNEVPQTTPRLREDGLREWAHPNTGAQGVAIVDTPGTGSIFMKHETTAKNFLHRSDLVVFLFNAKQAFAESERLYLELAQHYGKKVILVINQVDLLTPAEQNQVLSFVRSKVKETLDIDPPIFMVSSKEAMANTPEDAGGIGAVKAHLRGVYSQAEPAKQKLLAELDTVERIMRSHADAAREKTSLVTMNVTKVRTIENEMESQSVGLSTRQRELNQNILNTLEGIRYRGTKFIDEHMKIIKFERAASKAEMEKEFQEVVIGRSLRDMNELVTGYINTVIDQSRLYWNGVIERLNKLQDLLDKQKGGYDAGVYAEQRENLEEAIRIAETELQANTSGKVLEQLTVAFENDLVKVWQGGGIILGGMAAMILAIAAPGAVVASPPLLLILLGGGAATIAGGWRALPAFRRATTSAKKDLNTRIDGLIKSYNEALEDLTRKERNRLTQYGKQQLVPIFSRLETLAREYSDRQAELESYERQLRNIRQRIEFLDD